MNKTIVISGLVVALFVVFSSIAWASNSNYSLWRSIVGERNQQINEKNFDSYTDMHKMMADGDYAGAEKTRESLGIGNGSCSGQGNGCGASKRKGCGMNSAEGTHAGFADKNNNGVCDNKENLK